MRLPTVIRAIAESSAAGARTNVGGAERILSLLLGGMLVATSGDRRDLPGRMQRLAGGLLAARGATGRCPVFHALRVDTTATEDAAALPPDLLAKRIDRVAAASRAVRQTARPGGLPDAAPVVLAGRSGPRVEALGSGPRRRGISPEATDAPSARLRQAVRRLRPGRPERRAPVDAAAEGSAGAALRGGGGRSSLAAGYGPQALPSIRIDTGSDPVAEPPSIRIAVWVERIVWRSAGGFPRRHDG